MAEEDIIYGKKRHFFGGIEPSNMLDFKVHPKYTYVDKTETLSPTKTIGAIVGCYPISSSSLQPDSSITISGKLDYGYGGLDPEISVYGVKVGSMKKIGSIWPTYGLESETLTMNIGSEAFEGLKLYEHSGGSTNPLNDGTAYEGELTFTMNKNTMTVNIISELPNDTVIEGQTLCTVAGAIIRRKTDGYPVNEFDGTFVADIKNSCEIRDSDVEENTLYYYAAFPYTTQEVFNRNPANRASLDPENRNYYLYGFDLDTTDSDPDTRVSYPSDVDNADFTPAAMNYSTSTFDYGDWPSAPGVDFMPRPCILNYDGTVNAYLNPDNYAKTVDGATSNVSSPSLPGNVMMEWPKIYTQRKLVNGVYKFRCSNVPLGDDWDCWCNYDINDNEIDHFYTAVYLGISNLSASNGVLRSLSNNTITTSATTSSRVGYAEANGDGWYIDVLADRLLIQDLLVMMARSTDCQTAYGNGRVKSSSKQSSGTLDNKGMFWGSNDNSSNVKVFGMEDFWGNLARSTAGLFTLPNSDSTDGVYKVKITSGKHDGSSVVGYNSTGDGYLEYDYSGIMEGTSKYISGMDVYSFGRLPGKSGGSATTYEADIVYYSYSSNGTSQNPTNARFGGDYDDTTAYAGPFAIDASSGYGLQTGYDCVALSCKPLAE